MYVFHVGMIGMFDLAMFMSLCVNVMVMSSVLLVPVVLECQRCIC